MPADDENVTAQAAPVAIDEEEAIMAASRVVAHHKPALQQAAAAEDPGAAAALVDRIVAETRAQTDPVCPAWTRVALHTMARSNCRTHASLPQASGKPMAGLSDENVKGAIACVLTWQRVRGPAYPCLSCNCGY